MVIQVIVYNRLQNTVFDIIIYYLGYNQKDKEEMRKQDSGHLKTVK